MTARYERSTWLAVRLARVGYLTITEVPAYRPFRSKPPMSNIGTRWPYRLFTTVANALVKHQRRNGPEVVAGEGRPWCRHGPQTDTKVWWTSVRNTAYVSSSGPVWPT